MRAASPGEIVGVLQLVAGGEGRIQAASNRERAGKSHHWRLGVGPSGSAVAAGDVDQRLLAYLLRRVRHGIGTVLNNPLEGDSGLVDDVVAEKRRQTEDGRRIAATVALDSAGQLAR